MNIICMVPSLNLKHSAVYVRLRQLLGDSITRDITPRSTIVKFKEGQVIFAVKEQDVEQYSAICLDYAIIADKDISEEWMLFLKSKLICNNGLMLKLI